MPATAVLGLQWGDEGKGKIVDLLARGPDLVVRCNGGDNAGHAVKVDGARFGLQLVPSSIFRPGTTKILAAGMVINPDTLLAEVAAIERAGLSLGELAISDRAHVILPWHLRLDCGGDQRTMRRGIGPAYADKALRVHALRVGDLMHPAALRRRLNEIAAHAEAGIRAAGGRVHFDLDAVAAVLRAFVRRFRAQVRDTSVQLQDALARGRHVLLEGAQGTLLDVDHGSWPFVTASSTVAAGLCAGAGIAPRHLTRVVGVVKAYLTRVGAGPFPTEASARDADALRQAGLEFGVATGRLRRCGWLDLVALRHAVRLNQPDELALTKLDVLSAFDRIPVCVAYRIGRHTTTEFPADPARLAAARPVYERLPGWRGASRDEWRTGRRARQAPAPLRAFVRAVADAAGVPVRILSFGAERDDTMRIAPR